VNIFHAATFREICAAGADRIVGQAGWVEVADVGVARVEQVEDVECDL